MNKNTGDGELDKIFFEFHKEADTAWKQKNYKTGLKAAQDKAKAAIKKYAAQEANKAQRQLLKGLMEQKKEFESRIDDVPVYLDAIPAIVIQNKLEGLS